jgi:hypothetical protein
VVTILHALGMFVRDMFKSQCRLEAENPSHIGERRDLPAGQDPRAVSRAFQQ